MENQRNELLERILNGYSGYFDVERISDMAADFCALAQFHSRSEKYVLTKNAKLWAAEAHEYVFFATADSLDAFLWQKLAHSAIKSGLERVKPHSEHMYSYISLVVLASSLEPEAKREIKRTRFRKSFKFSFHGWTELRCAVIDLDGGAVVTNFGGRDMKKHLARYL